ncbi:MAG: HAD family hydrolase [Ignavibacteriota bacterium]|nr:HAD family hydrolase [Ignavibacteriota bacterium]
MKKAVFLDRDGTINFDVGYLSKVNDISIFEGVVPSLKSLKESGFLNLIITNQSGIARGYFSEKDLLELHDEFKRQLSSDGITLIDDIFYSPFHADGIIEQYTKACSTRKPGIGMIEEAVKKFNVDLSCSYFIGDSLVDMQCAENAGLRKILVKTGYGLKTITECEKMNIKIDYIAERFSDASEYIIHKEKA